MEDDGMNSILNMSDETNEKIKRWFLDHRRNNPYRKEIRSHRRGGCMACRRYAERKKLKGGRRLSLFEKIKRYFQRKEQEKLDEKRKKMEELEAEFRAIDEEDTKTQAPQPQPQIKPPEYIPQRPPPRPYYEPEPVYNTYKPQDLITDHQTPDLNQYFSNPQRTDVDFYFMKQEYDPSSNMILPTY